MDSAVLVVLALIVLYFVYTAYKSPGPSNDNNTCTPGGRQTCADQWDVVPGGGPGTADHTYKLCGPDGKWVQGVGPDNCIVACNNNELPCVKTMKCYDPAHETC